MKFNPLNIILKNRATITIREATTDDAQELIDVVKEYIEDSESIPYAKDEFNPTIEFEKEWIQTLNDDENSLLLLAIHKQKIIGNISLNGSQRKMIAHMAGIGIGLLSEWRNKGVGSILFNTVIEWAKINTQLEILWLETYATNEAGIALYKKYGFEKEGRRKNCFKTESGGYFDNITMSLKIK